MRVMRKQVLQNDVNRWSIDFLTALRGTAIMPEVDDDPLGELEWTIDRIRRP
jgi:hypothetical protein